MSGPAGSDVRPMSRSAVYGATGFAVVVLVLVGLFQILIGVAAIAADEIFLTGVDYVFMLDVSAWGWIHLIVGIVAVAVAIGIAMGKQWARIGGIAVATLSTLTHFAFLPYYPLWCLLVIAFCVVVIWALCVQVDYDDRR